MITKIKIDLANGLVEVEGSEEFVRGVYVDFKEQLMSDSVVRREAPPPGADSGERDNGSRPKPKTNVKKRSQPASTAGAQPKKKNLDINTVVKSLDLSGSPAGRLRDFYAQFEVKTNYERNLIFIYFMEHKMEIEGITQDHVYTCYRDIPGIKVPAALRQSLLDTENDRGWIDASDPEDLKVIVHGVNHLEHDMPKKAQA